MITNDILAESQKYIMNTYGRQPLVFVKGRGTRVFDSDGREYIDFVSGVAVNNLGIAISGSSWLSRSRPSG